MWVHLNVILTPLVSIPSKLLLRRDIEMNNIAYSVDSSCHCPAILSGVWMEVIGHVKKGDRGYTRFLPQQCYWLSQVSKIPSAMINHVSSDWFYTQDIKLIGTSFPLCRMECNFLNKIIVNVRFVCLISCFPYFVCPTIFFKHLIVLCIVMA